MFNEVENLETFDSRYDRLRMHGCMHVWVWRSIFLCISTKRGDGGGEGADIGVNFEGTVE